MIGTRPNASRRPRTLLVAGVIFAWTATALVASEERRPDYFPSVYAIQGAKLFVAPGQTIESGTVVVRDGVIETVGPVEEVEIPYDAEPIDGDGLVLLPGFLDLFTTVGQASNAVRSNTGLSRPIKLEEFAQASTPPDNRNGLTPEFQVATALEVSESLAEARRKLGFTDLLSAPNGAIATGQSALVGLSGSSRREAVVQAPVALHINLANPRGRQFGDILDLIHDDELCAGAGHRHGGVLDRDLEWIAAALHGEHHDHGEAMADAGPPDSGGYPGALMGVIAHLRQAMLDAEYHQQLQAYSQEHGGARPPYDPALEALQAARNGHLPVWWEANSAVEIHRVLDLAHEFGTSAVIVGGREAYKVADRLKEEGVPVVLRVNFPGKPEVPTEEEYQKKLLKERTRPLRASQQDLKDWEERVACAKVLAEQGIPFAFATDGVSRTDTFHDQVRAILDAGLSADDAIAALTASAAEIAGIDDRLGTIETGKLGHLVAWSKEYDDKDAKVRFVLIDGRKFEYNPPSENGENDRPRRERGASRPQANDTKVEEAEAAQEPQQEPAAPFDDVATEFDEDREPTLQTGGDVFIKDVTILTVTNGTIPKGSILIKGGKIEALGEDLDAPEGITIIEAEGMAALPGIIDTHSHMAISGGVNEGSLSLVPEVRIKDVINSDDLTIYRAAAGGVTAARLFHGSANTIGGQDGVIKLHYGKPAHELLIDDGPQGIKFALGENVTRKRSSSPNRFPFSRMGVEAVLIRAFDEAKHYKAQLEAHEAAQENGEVVRPFRRDLRLEALADILDGDIKVHSHCYRADEILMLLRTAEQYGIKIQSLHHVLEGYKIAPEIAAHGASSSTFSDWWAYKVEAYDAIPYNAALITEAGGLVCIKSDSGEEVRHLYQEAAKMVRFGDVSEEQALAMVTINPARELGLDHRLGSIEIGKDADIALYDAHPLDGFAQCQLTLVDGEVVFQRHKGDGPLLKPRDGDHPSMPLAARELRDLEVEIPFHPEGVYALVNATIHPVTGPTIEGGTLVIDSGMIASLGGPETSVPDMAQTIDLGGLDVWPGMIDAGNTTGLSEIGSISATQDASELAPHQPELRASVAINPDSALIAVNRQSGVLSTYVQPTGGTIAGQGVLVDLYGWIPPEMVVVDELALNINVPQAPPENLDELIARTPGAASRLRERAETQQKRLDELKAYFQRAKAYAKVVSAAEANGQPLPAPDPRLSALRPYVEGKKPVIFSAGGRNEILTALELAEEFELKAILSGGDDAWKVADAIREAGVPVIVQGTQKVPGRSDPYDAAYANPAKLLEAGVTFCVSSTGRASESRNLPFEVAMAVGHGLPEDEGLKAVTLAPAEILGVADELGSIDVGKRANLVITAGHLLQPTTVVKHLFIGGRPLAPTNRHTELYERYKQRLDEVRSGSSPLGLDRDSEPVSRAALAPAVETTPTEGGGGDR